MKQSERWFAKNERQAYRQQIVETPVVSMIGPNTPGATSSIDKQKLSGRLFTVGKSEVGGEEVVG